MLNRCTFIGNLGKDPEVSTTESGIKYMLLSIACNDPSYTKKDGTVVPEKTEWIRCVAWTHTAEFLKKHASKGSKIYIEGKFRTRKYQDSKGADCYVSEIVVDNVELLTPKKETVPPPSAPDAPATSNQNPPDDLPF